MRPNVNYELTSRRRRRKCLARFIRLMSYGAIRNPRAVAQVDRDEAATS